MRLARIPLAGQEVELDASSRPGVNSWAARPGDILTVLDPLGGSWRLRLTAVDDLPRGVPFARLERSLESPLVIEVYQALPTKERFELVLQKLTELGVARIIPVETQRSATQAQRDAGQRKSHRWPAVIQRAARQCRRPRLPELYGTCDFGEVLQMASLAELRLMLYEGEEVWSLSEALGGHRPERVALLIGPEGGFAPEEVAAARASGFLPVGLGPRLLRTETAAIVGTTLLQGLLGDLC